MKNSFLFIYLTFLFSSSGFSQIIQDYVWPVDGDKKIFLSEPTVLVDNSSMFFLTHQAAVGGSFFYLVELDHNTLEERRIGHQDHTPREVANNTNSALAVFFQDQENIFFFYSDGHPWWISPNSADERVQTFFPISMVRTPKSNLNESYVKELRADGYYFCGNRLQSLCNLEDKETFFGFGKLIHESKIDLLSNNPGQGFEHIHPCWFIFDKEGNVLNYEIISEEDMSFLGQHLHYEQEENKIYSIGGTLDKERFPVDADFNGILAIFDLETNSFEQVTRYNNTSDTLFSAHTALWNNGEFLVNGVKGWDVFKYPQDSLSFAQRFNNAGGVLRFDGNHQINSYTNGSNFDGRSVFNHAIYEDTDTSFFLLRNSPVVDMALVDPNNIWLTRMSKDGPPLDTIKIAHGLTSVFDIFMDGANVDTNQQEILIWGSYAVSNLAYPVPYYFFVFKLDLLEVIKLYTAVNENDLELLDKHGSIAIYPTVFDEHFSLYNSGKESLSGTFRLYNTNGSILINKEVKLIGKSLISIKAPLGLTPGSYFYQLDLGNNSHQGVLIKE